MEHCSQHFYSSSLLQTYFIGFVTFSSIGKHPNKSFLTLYIFGHFYTLFTLYIYNINIFHFNVNFFEQVNMLYKKKNIKKQINGTVLKTI